MAHINIEIKAKSNNQNTIREILKSKKADNKGTDHQIDTYFKVNNGRLKLREGTIENYLIHYQRENKEGPKQSNVTLFSFNPESSLKEVLTKALGILVVEKAIELGKPYIIATSTYHHDDLTQLICDYQRSYNWPEIVDCSNWGKKERQKKA